MISSLLGWSSSILSSSVITGRVEYFSSKLCITSKLEVVKVASGERTFHQPKRRQPWLPQQEWPHQLHDGEGLLLGEDDHT